MPKHLYRMAASVIKVRSHVRIVVPANLSYGWASPICTSSDSTAQPSPVTASLLALASQTSLSVQQVVTSLPRRQQLSSVQLTVAQQQVKARLGIVEQITVAQSLVASSARITLRFACLQHFSRPGILEQIVPYLPSRRQQQMEAARAGGAPQAVADAQAACKQHNRTAQATELSKVSKSLEPTLPQVGD